MQEKRVHAIYDFRLEIAIALCTFSCSWGYMSGTWLIISGSIHSKKTRFPLGPNFLVFFLWGPSNIYVYPFYVVLDHFWGVWKGFWAIFVSGSHFYPLKFFFLGFGALKIGFLGLKRYQNDCNIGPPAWRY